MQERHRSHKIETCSTLMHCYIPAITAKCDVTVKWMKGKPEEVTAVGSPVLLSYIFNSEEASTVLLALVLLC